MAPVYRGEDSFGEEIFTVVGRDAKDLDGVDTTDGLRRTFREIATANSGVIINLETGETVFDSQDVDDEDDG